jgi:hypothetical protein
MGKWEKGTYKIINKEKYIGDKEPIFRSSWEKRFMYYCDMHKNILKWGSECVVIPYMWIDGKVHRYYVDFFVELINATGQKERMLIEVKPKNQVPELNKPVPPKRKTQKSMFNFNEKLTALNKNKLKWESAEAFCKKKGWTFKVITEDDIFRNY